MAKANTPYRVQLLKTRNADYVRESLNEIKLSEMYEAIEVLLRRSLKEKDLARDIKNSVSGAFGSLDQNQRDETFLLALDLEMGDLASEFLYYSAYEPSAKTWDSLWDQLADFPELITRITGRWKTISKKPDLDLATLLKAADKDLLLVKEVIYLAHAIARESAQWTDQIWKWLLKNGAKAEKNTLNEFISAFERGCRHLPKGFVVDKPGELAELLECKQITSDAQFTSWLDKWLESKAGEKIIGAKPKRILQALKECAEGDQPCSDPDAYRRLVERFTGPIPTIDDLEREKEAMEREKTEFAEERRRFERDQHLSQLQLDFQREIQQLSATFQTSMIGIQGGVSTPEKKAKDVQKLVAEYEKKVEKAKQDFEKKMAKAG